MMPELSGKAADPTSVTKVVCQGGGSAPKESAPRHSRVIEELLLGSDQFGFSLMHELGRGGFARVFLAQQIDLAGRLVVLKFSDLEGAEPQTLAQLQHTHIVPIYSVHEDHGAGLRAVCMPYFGGATLAQLLDRLWEGSKPPSAGPEWLEALAAVQAPVQPPDLAASLEADAPIPLGWLRRHSYRAGAVWIVARLAEALHYAHVRRVIHRDIKPSNILIAADGQPLLLDFNVARNESLGADQTQLGGTVTYAAPEHLRALYSQQPQDFQRVDERSDLYSLGLVLFKMVTGTNPWEEPTATTALASEQPRPVPSAREHQSDIPWSLESILRRCLAADPAQRYQRAGELAEDLRRYLNDEPLRHAPELSRRERLEKWGRRHPRLVSSAAVAAVAALLLFATAAVVVAVHRHLVAAQESIAVTAAQQRRAAYEAGTQRALCLVNTVSELPDRAGRGKETCEKTLGLYGVLDRPDWQEHADWRRLDSTGRRALAEHTRELLMLLAWAGTRTAASDPQRLHDGLALLDRAAAIANLPASPALMLERASFLDLLGKPDEARKLRVQAERTQSSGAHDHYLLATVHVREDGARALQQALAELDQAVALNPRHYWALAQRGLCRLELGDTTLATADFSTCIGLWPEFAFGYFNRGYALAKSGHPDQAVEDFGRALQHDPEFVEAYLNRGLLYLEKSQSFQALRDFDEARRLGRDDAFLHAGRGMALTALARHEAADEAFKLALTRSASLPQPSRTRILWAYGSAIQARLPHRARALFDEVLSTDPSQPQALYGRAALAVDEGDLMSALDFFDRAAAAAPDMVAARRGRAVVRARLQQWEPARQDINWCLDREPQAGITLYAAACVAALAADKSPAAAQQALSLLEKAFGEGYGVDKALHDADLRALRSDAAFRRLLSQWGVLSQ